MVALSIFLNGFTLDSYDLPLHYQSSQKLTSEFMLRYVSVGNNLTDVRVNTEGFLFCFSSSVRIILLLFDISTMKAVCTD